MLNTEQRKLFLEKLGEIWNIYPGVTFHEIFLKITNYTRKPLSDIDLLEKMQKYKEIADLIKTDSDQKLIKLLEKTED